jgi:hypothetical protein
VRAAHLAQRSVAALAGRRFDAAGTLLHRHLAHVERYAEFAGGRGAVVAPGIGVRAQSVVDVKGEQRRSARVRVGMREAQQDHRIEAAAERHRDRGRAVLEKRIAQGVQRLRDLGREIRGRTGRWARSAMWLDHSSSRGRVSLNLP